MDLDRAVLTEADKPYPPTPADLAAAAGLPVTASQQKLHAFCRAHGWRVELVAGGRARRPVDCWAACSAAIVELRRRPDAGRWQLRALGLEPRGHPGAIVDADEGVIAPALSADLQEGASASPVTPRIQLLPSRATERAAAIAAVKSVVRDCRVNVEVAYSVKTNPGPDALELARSCDCLAEAVSQLEVATALAAGFAADQIVLNGPAKWWPDPIELPPLRALFCDSLPELVATLEQLLTRPQLAAVMGVRLRAPGSTSRFGVPVDTRADLDALARTLSGLPESAALGVHFHAASSQIGIGDWFELCEWSVLRATALQEASGHPVRCLDLGGGWHPDDLAAHLIPALPRIAAIAAGRLPQLETIIIEPGRALVQPIIGLFARVLEVRECGASREIVVDASVSEVAEAGRYPHPVFVREPAGGGWRRLTEGVDRVAGRSCMEADLLATGVCLPAAIGAYDLIAIDQVGAYDTSKSYDFGRG